MVEVSVLATGSSGNCFYLQGNGSGFLVDAGISCLQIRKRLEAIGKDVSQLKGIFITHEHVDHVRGVRVLAKRYGIPLYVSRGTYEKMSARVDDVRIIGDGDSLSLACCRVDAFEKCHDAVEPLSFAFSYNDSTVSVITDAGIACENTRRWVQKSDILCLESNYDDVMLAEGPYPYYLKERIKGRYGHLSNYDAALMVLEHASSRLRHVVLSHLSLNNNTPEKAYETFTSMIRQRSDMEGLSVSVGRRDVPGELIRL